MKRHIVAATLSTNYANKVFRGRKHYVVPVVMLMQTVVNGAFVPEDALHPGAWNGVPVTISHPVNKRGESITANSPETLEKWQVGTIFNAKVEDGKLKGEAWIDIELANKLAPGLLATLRAKGKMDVSTGYFTVAKAETGEYNGVTYKEVHHDLKPDHLALLPEEEGACNWETGCGVRANSAKGKPMKNARMLSLLAKLIGNAEGEEEDEKTPATNEEVVSELIESDETPFTEDDRETLEALPMDALEVVKAELLGGETNADDEGDDEEDDAAANQKNNSGCGCAKPKANAKGKGAGSLLTMTPDQLAGMIANAAKDAVRAEIGNNARRDLVARIVGNKSLGLTAKDCEGMTLTALQKLAGEAAAEPKKKADAPKANYAGRGMAKKPDTGSKGEPQYPGMATHGKAPVKTEEKGE